MAPGFGGCATRSAARKKLLSFGPYPEVTLAAARAARDAARGELRTGLDPSLTRQAKRAAAVSTDNRFETIARAWHEQAKAGWGSKKHQADVLLSLEGSVFPALGKLPIRDITSPIILNVLCKVESRQAIGTTHRIRQRISAVFKYAIGRGLADLDPSAAVGAALKQVVRGKQPALVQLSELQTMLAAVEVTPAHPVTKLAHRLLALTATRPGEIRGAAWGKFSGLDTARPVWIIPAERMKMGEEHTVPLSKQAVEVV